MASSPSPAPAILEIRLPHDDSGETLPHQLLALWPSYLAFALSFFVILVTWIPITT
jgi:uncharacterized membrane protein